MLLMAVLAVFTWGVLTVVAGMPNPVTMAKQMTVDLYQSRYGADNRQRIKEDLGALYGDSQSMREDYYEHDK
jgi:hypothetical protein